MEKLDLFIKPKQVLNVDGSGVSIVHKPSKVLAELGRRNVYALAPFVHECVSMATLVCVHGTAILTNHESSKLVAECMFYA